MENDCRQTQTVTCENVVKLDKYLEKCLGMSFYFLHFITKLEKRVVNFVTCSCVFSLVLHNRAGAATVSNHSAESWTDDGRSQREWQIHSMENSTEGKHPALHATILLLKFSTTNKTTWH